MFYSIGQTIEKIKLQEQNNEVKLREKRELDNTILSLNRTLRDSLLHLEKLSKEYECLTTATDKLQQQLVVEKTRLRALVDLVSDCNKELEELRDTTNDGVSAVWSKRSKLLETIQMAADKCDIWALLTKHTCNDIVSGVKDVKNTNAIQKQLPDRNDSLLKNAIERRNKALAKRNYLLTEPESGEEFIRFARNCRTTRSFSSKPEPSENEPIKFSTSQAARKTTKPLIRKVNTEMPWYQPFSVVGSVAIFLIYFCVLREENDIDLEFNKSLYDRIHGLEKQQLLLSYKFNKEHGKSVAEIEERLKELEG